MFRLMILAACLLPVAASAQMCLCCKKRDAGQAAFDRKDYQTALTRWQEGLELSDAGRCPDLKELADRAQSRLLDRDRDGVADKEDQCPDTPGVVALHGCPDQTDTDEDGTPDAQDDCPNAYGPKQYRGCPDKDFDETPDTLDACPSLPGPKNTAGCPDRDSDGVADKDDQCPDVPGLAGLKGCPDRDGDGVTDLADDCPDIAGLKRFKGCPDQDFDEIPDPQDSCRTLPGPKTAHGCPDGDGDGVADKKDKCPDVFGVAENNGCPEEKMVLIKGGTFIMGDLFGEGENNETQHSVSLADFYLGQTEVTFADFDAFCTATGRERPADSGWGRGKRPVINVDWYDAVEYCNWLSQVEKKTPAYAIDKSRLDPGNSNRSDTKKWIVIPNPGANGYRLPTEAEWEYAAREEGKKIRFGNGKDVADPTQMNFCGWASIKTPYSLSGEYRQKTVETGSLLNPNALSLHDMSGNVWEWCYDWYESYPLALQQNPLGAGSGAYRVYRGGSWNYGAPVCRAAFRNFWQPDFRCDYVGFRLALSL